MKCSVPDHILQVINSLRGAGFESLLAGGCVRDMLLAIKPDDFDIATSARPQEVVKLFRRTISIGAQFGVVVVMIGSHQVEVATFRSDFDYCDGRRPSEIVFTDAQSDALRRDFTINGMFYDPIADNLLDFVDGQQDLKAGIIRAIGNADQRFAEDHLRMLRAIRFASRFAYQIENDTWQAILANAHKIKKISAERIAAELEKIITHKNRKLGLQLALQSGLLNHILPERTTEQLQQGLSTLKDYQGKDMATAMALLLNDCSAGLIDNICRRLTFSNELRKKILWLQQNYQLLLDNIPLDKGHLKLWLAEPYLPDLRFFCQAILMANGQDDEKLHILSQQIQDLGDEEISPIPLINGNELLKLGVKPGPNMGKILQELYLLQLQGKINSYQQAVEYLNK